MIDLMHVLSPQSTFVKLIYIWEALLASGLERKGGGQVMGK